MNVFIKTYGCTLNQADSILMKNVLKNKGHKIVKKEEDAETVIINSCTVKKPTEDKILAKLNKLKQDNKRTIIAGCLSQSSPEILKKRYPNFNIIGVENIYDINKCLMKKTNIIKRKKIDKTNKFPIKKNKIIEIIPISSGCLGDCSYCETRFARGKLYSYPQKNIINHMRKGLKKGVKEFWITSQDTGAYGKDNNKNLIDLLKKISNIKEYFKTRIGMMNPKHAITIKKELSELLKKKMFFDFLHLPLQSGNNRILKLMNRDYEKKEFLKLINYFKKKIPKITIATDIIIGFPSETREEFNETINVIKKTRPDVINISRFWKRRHSRASCMKKQLAQKTIKKRIKKTVEVCEKVMQENNKEYVGKRFEALIDSNNKGRLNNYKPVIVENTKIGEKIKVKISDYKNTCLIGRKIL